jgi:hypothetical protein
MTFLFIMLFITTIYFFITTLYYKDKYHRDHNLVEVLDESTLMYYRQMVDIDMQNDLLKKAVDTLKIENAELKSTMYIGFPNRNVGGDAK